MQYLPPLFSGRVLAIETSCDETSAAIVSNGVEVKSNVVASQDAEHSRFGGIVPEIASRMHLERLRKIVWRALEKAGLEVGDIDAIAVTIGPGLAGSLLVGIAGAKAIALSAGLPLIAVNHLEGHLFASLIVDDPPELPAVALLVSGGHTMLIHIPQWGNYQVIGSTLDDAAGEAFDKIGRFLGLGFPGGPAIDREARSGDPEGYSLPRAMLAEGYDFSFSGLKTAVVNAVEGEIAAGRQIRVADMAASFQEAVVDVLAAKAFRAASEFNTRSLLVGGGVAANKRLRTRLEGEARRAGIRCRISPPSLCTDNAAMIAVAGAFRFEAEGASLLDIGAVPGLRAPFRIASQSKTTST